VLIPRPDTDVWLKSLCAKEDSGGKPLDPDLCTAAVRWRSVWRELPSAQVCAMDISPRLWPSPAAMPGRIRWRRVCSYTGDLFEALRRAGSIDRQQSTLCAARQIIALAPK
jgi:hypothetical protein